MDRGRLVVGGKNYTTTGFRNNKAKKTKPQILMRKSFIALIHEPLKQGWYCEKQVFL
jgi:hypothetical protein